MIIAFSGLDGAGKSTQIKLLEEYLLSSGKAVKYIWARGGYTPGFNMLKGILRKAKVGGLPPAGISKERTKGFSTPWKRKVWLYLAIADMVLLYAIMVRVKSWLGTNVIADRWIDDTELDFELNFPEEKVASWWTWKLLRWLSPKPDTAFLLTIPIEVSMQRSLQKNEPFPDSRAVLENRLVRYLRFEGEWIHIDGTLPINMIHRKIIDSIL